MPVVRRASWSRGGKRAKTSLKCARPTIETKMRVHDTFETCPGHLVTRDFRALSIANGDMRKVGRTFEQHLLSALLARGHVFLSTGDPINELYVKLAQLGLHRKRVLGGPPPRSKTVLHTVPGRCRA